MQAYSLSQGNLALVRRNWNQGWYRSRPGVLHRSALNVQAFTAQAEAPAKGSDVVAPSLHPSYAQLLQGLKGPLVKFTAHYHVNFGDSLKVIGSTEEFGTWNAAAAPNMNWGEGDIWSLVMPVTPGEHEFKVLVQLGNGELLWEGGSNRKVTVPADAPLGTMLVADCAFNYAEMMTEPLLQPVSDDVLQLLEAKAEAEMSAQVEEFSQDLQKQHVSEAAAAVAKALATLDAEAEETVRRSFISSDEESEQVSRTQSSGGSGAAVEAESQEPALERDAQAETSTTATEGDVQQELPALYSEVPQPSAAEPSISAAASVRAKLAQDKPVAIGFVDDVARTAPAAADGSSVVAAFMKSVGKKPLTEPTADAPAAEQIPTEAVQETMPDAQPKAAGGSDLAVQETAAIESAEPALASAGEAITVATEAEDAASPVAEVFSPANSVEDYTPSAASDSSSAASPGSSSTSRTEGALSSRGRSATPTPSSSPRGSRPPSPGRGSSHVAAATAAAAMDWMEGVKSNGVVAAAREAEEEARSKAARLAAAREAASAAANEAAKLNQDLHSSVSGSSTAPRFRLGASFGATADEGGSGDVAMAMPAPPEVVPAARDQAYSARRAASAAAAPGLSPPPVSSPVSISSNSSTANSPVLAATADIADTGAAADVAEGAADWSGGMQMVSAVVGCAAVGTVLWSEFVLKETGCGLPPGPYGLLGAAEGLSYLAVLGFAGTGLAARGSTGARQGLPGPLAVPEVLAYGALAAGLLVLASQLHDYGYIPPPLPGGQCYPDAAVASLPNTDELSAQLAAQLAALQAILSQLKSAAAEGIDSLQLQQQLAQLQLQVDSFSAYVAIQASSVDAQLQSGLLQLQDSLANATTAVSTFVDTQLQQLDIPGKLAFVVDVLKKQEQQLVVELPKQFAELQKLAATATAMVQETALQAATASHLPELLASLDKSMGVLHDVLELRIQQLDVVLTQLHDNCAAAATQLATAARAAHEAGLTEASAQLAQLQALLADAMARVQGQVWAGYQQLALADHLSDMLLKIRTSAAEVAASTTAEYEKLHLQQQLAELETIAASSVTALSSNAMDQLSKLELEQRLTEIEQQAAAAAVSLKNGLVQQYQEQMPVLQQRLGSLQDSLAGWAADAQRGVRQQNVEELLHQLQQSMEATAKAVREVAASSADSAGQQLQVASSSLSSNLEHMSSSVSQTLNSSGQSFGKVVSTAADAAKSAAQPMKQIVASAPSAVRESTAAIPPVANSAAAMDLTDDLVALTPDIDAVKQIWEADDFIAPGVDLREASDAVKSIWANRPQ